MWALLDRHQRHETSRTLTLHTHFLSLTVTSLSSYLFSVAISLTHALHFLLSTAHIISMVQSHGVHGI